MLFLSFLLGCRPDCPPNSFPEEGCLCEEDFYGTIAWDKNASNWSGECISGLEMAVQTGDPNYIQSEQSILTAAQEELQETIDRNQTVLRELYADDGVYYNPSEWSNHIQTADIDQNWTLVQGSDIGYPLASAGARGNSRYAAFGMNVVVSLDNGQQDGFQAPFARLLSWLLEDEISPSPTPNHRIGVSAIGWDQNQTIQYFSELFDTVEDCDAASNRTSCYQDSDLIVLGAQAAEEITPEIISALQTAMQSGSSVLYLHTEIWSENEQGRAILQELRMNYGEYGGNYWAMDKAEWADVEDMLAQGGTGGAVHTLLRHFSAQDYRFDWEECTDFVGQVSCHDVSGFRSEFLTGAQVVRLGLSNMDENNIRLFEEDGYRIWKLLTLLGDVYRRDISYPMSKTDTDIMPFMRSYYADHAVLYHRGINPKQQDLGTFSPSLEVEASTGFTEVNINASKHGGYTAIGHYAIPGKAFHITRVDALDIDASLLINTQRTGSTREFNDGQYDRPKFLQSNIVPLPSGEKITLSTPYGGTLQLMVSASENDPTIELHLEEVGEHPVLDYGSDPANYLGALENTPFPFTEIRTPYVQIHSKVDMMKTAIARYDGDIQVFFEEMQYYMIEDTYNLAGFQGEGLALNDAVLGICHEFGWNCEDAAIHASPALQHINVDTYAHCGGGCSGNPYDQSWPLEPLGWGETHEIGHNLQRGRLGIYGGRSSEVSNQIFPLHKHATYYKDTGIALSGDRVAYQDVFDTLQASVNQADPFSYVYETIWANEGIYDNNAERMVFYMQVVHCHDDLEFLESGWDVYTLMYLHERLFSSGLDDWENQRVPLGFDQYTEPPWEISGNDFMLISMSYISRRDQRPFFDMWGIDYTSEASAQVEAYALEEAIQHFFPSVNANAAPFATPVPIDGTSPWPQE
ncbi:MAG: ImpA family metalloprotease [Myxococcota bacterium]|nr:ImpA family metalloprotease [Myxococcota bacterium]